MGRFRHFGEKFETSKTYLKVELLVLSRLGVMLIAVHERYSVDSKYSATWCIA